MTEIYNGKELKSKLLFNSQIAHNNILPIINMVRWDLKLINNFASFRI